MQCCRTAPGLQGKVPAQISTTRDSSWPKDLELDPLPVFSQVLHWSWTDTSMVCLTRTVDSFQDLDVNNYIELQHLLETLCFKAAASLSCFFWTSLYSRTEIHSLHTWASCPVPQGIRAVGHSVLLVTLYITWGTLQLRKNEGKAGGEKSVKIQNKLLKLGLS